MKHEEIIKALGGTVEVARLCECSPQAVSQWFGFDMSTGRERFIPNSRLLYLKAIRPHVFALSTRRKKRANPKAPAQGAKKK